MQMSPTAHDSQRDFQAWMKEIVYLAERDAKRLEEFTSRTAQDVKDGICEAINRKICAVTNWHSATDNKATYSETGELYFNTRNCTELKLPIITVNKNSDIARQKND